MPATTQTFHWTEAYSVNIAVLDEQHRKLFATVNELDAALRAGRGSAVMNSVLQKLVNYATEHFAAEESLMARHDFPGLFTHQIQHALFRRKIDELLADYQAGKSGVPVSLMLFMQDWLKQHVLKTDKLYSAFLNARGVR